MSAHAKVTTLKWANFAKGLNTVRQVQDLQMEELSDVMNFRYVLTPDGVGLTSRPGIAKLTGTSALSTAGIKDIHKYVDSTGKVFYLAVSNSKLYSSTLGTSTTFTSVGDLGSTRGRMVNFAGRCCIADGAAMKYFVSTGGTDAGTFGTCTGSPPSATMVVVNGDRLIANDTTSAYKNAIKYCQLRDPQDWTTSGAAGTIYLSEVTEVTGLNKFYGLVLIHGSGPKNVLKLTGTTPSDFAIVRAIPGAGAVGPDQAITLSNDVLFLDTPGVISFRAWERFGDIEQSVVSDAVGNLIRPIASTTTVMGRQAIDQQVFFYDGSSSYILYYDAQYGIWGKYWFGLGTSVTPTCITDLDGVLYIGDSAGHIWRMDTTETVWQDNSVDYSLYWKGCHTDVGTNLKKQAKYCLGQLSANSGATANIELYKNLSGAANRSLSITAPPLRLVSAQTGSNTVTAATYFVNESGDVTTKGQSNFEFQYIGVGMTSIDGAASKVTINEVSVDIALLSRE